MSEQSQLNFNIPKIKRQLSKDNLRNVALTSRDAVELLQSVDRCYLDTEVKGQWEVKSIQTFDNRDLEKAYREKRTELKDNGRHARELTEQYGFMYVKEINVIVPSIAKHGLRTKAGQFNGLGDSKSGVYVNKHPDVQLKIAEQKDDKTAYLCVFKLTLGRCKAQQISNSSENPIEPTPNYDSHVSASAAQVNTLHSVQLQRSQVYLYEYTDEALPSERPRHCLPYALLQYEKTKASGSTYGRSAYGSKTTNVDYSRKAGQSAGSAQRKSRGDGSTSRRGSYESGTSYTRQDSIPKPGREDPRMSRKRSSIDATVDPRLISTDPRVSGVDPRMSTNDPRVKIDPRLATTDPRMQGDPRLVQGDPQAVSRSLIIPPNQFTPTEQQMVSPEMKSMIKTVSQLWGTTPQSEVAFVGEDQADNSVVKQVQEQMEQKKAEKKKISLADYSKTRKKPTTVPVPTIPVTAVDVLTSVSSSSDSVSNAKMNQALISASSSVTNEIYPPSRFSIAKSPIAIVHYSPSVGASVTPMYAPETTALLSDYTQEAVEAAIIQSPVFTPLPTPLPIPVPAPVPAPEPTHFSELSSLSSTYPISLPSIKASPLAETPSPTSTPAYDSEPDFNDVMSTPISGSSIRSSSLRGSSVRGSSVRGSREFDEDDFDVSPSDAVSSSPVSQSLKSYNSETKDGEYLSLGVGEHVPKLKTLSYSPKGTAGYKDPYAAVKRQSIQPGMSTPVSLLPEGHPAVVNLFPRESPRSPRNEDVMYDPFEQSMDTAPVEADVFRSPVVSDLSERPAVDDIQSPLMSNPYSYEPSPVKCEIRPLYQSEYPPSLMKSQVEPSAGDMSDPQSDYQPSPIKSASVSESPLGYQPSPTKMGVHDNPFSFLKKDPIPVVQYSPISMSSQASALPESPSSESASSLALQQQSQGAPLHSNPAAQGPTSNQAYVSNLVSKFQSINPGDFKDILTKMKSLQSQCIPAQSESYRDRGSSDDPAAAKGIQDFQSDRPEFRSDTREDHCDSSARDTDTRQYDSCHSSRRDSDSYRDSRYSSSRDSSYSRSSSRYRDDKDERRRGSRHDDYWSRHDEDVDYRRRDSRRHKYDDDDRDRDHRSRDSRYDKRSYNRRNSPRQEDANRYGDVDLRSSRYQSPRRPERLSNVEEEKKTPNKKSRKFSSGGGDYEGVEEHVRTDVDSSNKSGTGHSVGEKCDDLSEGVWMAPRLDASETITTDTEMTPVKSLQPEDHHQPVPITLDMQKNLDKSEKRLLFDSSSKSAPEQGGLNERGNVFSAVFDLHGNTTPPRPPSRGRSSESPRVNQARSWTELIDEKTKDKKVDVKGDSDVEQEHPVEDESRREKSLMKSNQESATETMKFADKRGKKRKVAKDMAGYTKRKRGKRGRGKKNRLTKLKDENEHQPSWSPCPSDNFSIEFEHDEPDYCDFSFDQPHQYVETIPNSEDDDYSYVTETTTSMTSRTTSPTSEYLSHLGLSHLGKSDLLPVLELVDILKMSVTSCKQCCQCREEIIPYLQNIALDTSDEEQDDCPEEDDKPDIKGTEYYMKNCLPGLDLISPPEEKEPVVKQEVKAEKAIISEEKIHETVDIKPVVKEEKVVEKTIGYNSCEGDKPLYLKLQSTPTKAGRTEDGDSKETKPFSKPKLTEDGELDINGTHGVFSPMKGLVKRKLSITLCVGGKKKKSQAIAEADAARRASTPPLSSKSSSPVPATPASAPVTLPPSVGLGAGRPPPLPTVAPTIQYKVGVKKAVKVSTPSASEGTLQTEESSIPSSVPVRHGGQSIPVLGMSWSGPQTSTHFPSNDNVITTHSQSSALNEWSSVPPNSTMMSTPSVLNAPIQSLQHRPQQVGNESSAYTQVCQSNMNIGPPASTLPVVIPRYTQPSQVRTMVSQPSQIPTMIPQPTQVATMVSQQTQVPTMVPRPIQVPTMVPRPTQVPTMVPHPTQVPTMVSQPTMVPPPTRPRLPNYGYPQPHQIMPCGIPSISQQAPIVSQHTGSLQSLPIRLHQPPIPSVSQQMPLRHQQMAVSQQVHGRLQLHPSHPQGLPTNTLPMGQQLPLVRHPVMMPQTPDPGIHHLTTAYPHPPMRGNAVIQPQYSYPPTAPHCTPTRPPPRGFGIPVLGQQTQMPVQHAVPVSLEQSYNPAMFNPNQPQPVRLSRPASTLVQVHTSGPPETKRSSDPADWFADMFAPKKRETSWSKESTPESGQFSGFDKGGAGSGPSETSSVTSSPITQVPFLGESSRDVFSGETMHSGKDIKATNTPIKQVVLKSLVKRIGNDRSRSVSPEPNYCETNSTSPYSDMPSFSERNTPSPSKERLSKQPMDFLSKERAKILNALRNLPTSDSEESQVESKTEGKLEITVSSDSREQDVRRVEFQRNVETKTKDDDPYTRGSTDDRRKHGKENQDSKKKVGYFDRSKPGSMDIASKWTEYLQNKDKRRIQVRRREPVDYHDELELYKCDQYLPETMDNTLDDSSSGSGDSIEDLEELSIKLNYERSKAIGRVQEVPLTIEMYLKHKLFVSDPNKVRDKFPWPLNTVLTEQTKNKRRRMVQKAKIVASHYAKKQSKGKEEEHPVNSRTSSKFQEVKAKAEIKLEDFTKEQILVELQVVQEFIKKCSNAGTCQKNIGQPVNIQNPKQQMTSHMMPSQTCPNPNVENKIQDVRENVLDMERAKNLGMTVVQFQQMKAQNMKRQIMMNNTCPQMTSNPGMMKQLQMIDPPMNNPRIDNNPQKSVFEKLKEIQMLKLQKIQMTRSPSNTENQEMDVSFDQVEPVQVLGQSDGLLNCEKAALQQIAQDLIEGFQKLTCVGRPHQKVPDDILLQSEKNKYHSEEGVFLMLLSAISKKPYLRLLSMKVDLEMLVKQKLEAATKNKTSKVGEMRRNIKKLHDERKKLLTTFVGSLGKKRLRKLNIVRNKYQLGVSYLRKELGDEGWRRLQYIYTMHQTINTHVHIVQVELASPTL